MKIHIGSKNVVKVDALRELLKEHPHLKDAHVEAFETSSGVADQPKSIEETVEGAITRAKNVRKDAEYGFGLESGLMKVPSTKSGFMDVCVCAIYDGEECHLGLSSAWEVPQSVVEHMFNDNMNMNDAALTTGFTSNPEVGSAEGLIGVLTKGRLDRKAYTKEAIRTALIHLEKG